MESITKVDRTQLQSVKKLLPMGPIASGDPATGDIIRDHDLVQIWVDPGGMRTLNAADVFLSEKHARQHMER